MMEFCGCGCDESSLSPTIEILLRNEQTTYAQHDYFGRLSAVLAQRRERDRDRERDPHTHTNPHTHRVVSANRDSQSNSQQPKQNPLVDAVVDPSCRSVMEQWCVDLCAFCDYDRGTVVPSVMSCADRFVATPEGFGALESRSEYQLVVVVCFYLVVKMNQTTSVSSSTIAKLTRGKRSTPEIEEMERKILAALGWRINPPTPLQFAHEFLGMLRVREPESEPEPVEIPVRAKIKANLNCNCACKHQLEPEPKHEPKLAELVRCQLEAASGDYSLSCLYKPSRVAFAALWNALESIGKNSNNTRNNNNNKNKNKNNTNMFEPCDDEWSWSSSDDIVVGLGDVLGICDHGDWVDVHRACAALLQLVPALALDNEGSKHLHQQQQHRSFSPGGGTVKAHPQQQQKQKQQQQLHRGTNRCSDGNGSESSTCGSNNHSDSDFDPDRCTHQPVEASPDSPSSVVLRNLSSFLNSSSPTARTKPRGRGCAKDDGNAGEFTDRSAEECTEGNEATRSSSACV